jgi:DHA1 family multidrug resistance protein-like MFS transporter
MLDIIRDAPVGQLLRWLTRNRILLYPDERDDFMLPRLVSFLPIYCGWPAGLTKFQTSGAVLERAVPHAEQPDSLKSNQENIAPGTTGSDKDNSGKTKLNGPDARKPDPDPADSGKTESPEGPSTPPVVTREEEPHLSQARCRQPSVLWTEQRLELDQQLELEKTKSRPVWLSKPTDGTILVDWYSIDDPENPQNWSQGKKVLVLVQIW